MNTLRLLTVMFIKLEKAESLKFTHEQVGYQDPSTHGVDCDECIHFIPQTLNMPAGCEGVQRPIAESGWCIRFKEISMKHPHHGFTDTHVKHHADGSATVHHVHHEGPHKDVHHAVADHDALMDSMMEHTSAPNPGENQADQGVHGIPAPQAQMAGLPVQGA